MRAADVERIVDEVLEELPATLWERVENVQVFVEERDPREPDLYGLYDGVSHLDGIDAAIGLQPNRLFVYWRPLVEDFGHDPAVLRAQIRTTVLHELGHHFGMTESQLEQLGYE